VTDPVTPVSTTTPAIAFTGARLTDEWIDGGAAILLGLGLVALARRRRRQSPAGSSD
jgi:MYXO-CTERM domain-containing protein